MHLNIKNDEAHRLATRLAELTGESMTQAVTTALKEKIDQMEKKKTVQDRTPEETFQILKAIAEECAKHIDPSEKEIDHTAFLYDENGLPK